MDKLYITMSFLIKIVHTDVSIVMPNNLIGGPSFGPNDTLVIQFSGCFEIFHEVVHSLGISGLCHRQ
jgi:hypothetical protein